ncbi:Glycerol-3-phosphate dehydrogenase [NAD(+)], cytoplasmic, partial [Trichinella sp. T8]
LAELINRQHENVKYLPGIQLPKNIIASSDIALCVGDADILIMAVPQQFLAKTCENIVGKIKPTAIAVTTIKGIEVDEKGKMCVSSVIIQKILNIPVAALNGANIAPEVAEKHFCEATIGVQREQDGQLLKQVFNIPTFHVNVVRDLQTVEYCGALKNVVACAAGLVDGLKFGTNTKSAVIRIGFLEMINFIKQFVGEPSMDTFHESCGIADLIATCFSGRNRKVCEAFVNGGRTIEELEKELLGGQKLQGPYTAAQIYVALERRGLVDKNGLASTNVGQLAQPFVNFNRNVYVDCYFTSYSTVQHLLEHGLTAIGTVFAHVCRDVPACLRKAARRDPYSTLAVYEQNRKVTMINYVPRKNSNVLLLTSCHAKLKVCVNNGFLLMKTSAKLSEDKEAFYEELSAGQTHRNEVSESKI